MADLSGVTWEPLENQAGVEHGCASISGLSIRLRMENNPYGSVWA